MKRLSIVLFIITILIIESAELNLEKTFQMMRNQNGKFKHIYNLNITARPYINGESDFGKTITIKFEKYYGLINKMKPLKIDYNITNFK